MNTIEKAMTKVEQQKNIKELAKHLPDLIKVVKDKIDTRSLAGTNSEQQQEYFNANPTKVPWVMMTISFTRDLKNWNYAVGKPALTLDCYVSDKVFINDDPAQLAHDFIELIEEEISL